MLISIFEYTVKPRGNNELGYRQNKGYETPPRMSSSLAALYFVLYALNFKVI